MIPFAVYDQRRLSQQFRRSNCWRSLRGGHLGFLSREKPRFWLDSVVLDWAERLVTRQTQQSEARYGTNSVALTSD